MDVPGGGAAGSAGGQGGSRSLDGQGNPNGQGGEGAVGGAQVADANDGSVPCVLCALLPQGQGGEFVPEERRPGLQLHEFTLKVPFPSPLEAEIAQRSLAPYVEHLQAIHKEFAVDSSTLLVSWAAEDIYLLRISFTSFLDQLSLMVRAMQRFGTLSPPTSLPRKED
ncbi:EKC/KEOPS complex subunit LAGE3-like [Otolemur garnettii]|uniref:EKC/KEOPS complex subunit LAGE3-like n=1 Tax=Otolemur garnettii TaxID=30611 RepID=UPI000C7F6C49|nr:EKC/KEOPS complex subunit LAGE3-like [Otolemur garnettii]